ncbi:MAG: carbohydrate ABC transporter permease, partial [Rhizobium giardinii]
MTETNRNRLMLLIAIVMAAIYLFPLYWMYIT